MKVSENNDGSENGKLVVVVSQSRRSSAIFVKEKRGGTAPERRGGSGGGGGGGGGGEKEGVSRGEREIKKKRLEPFLSLLSKGKTAKVALRFPSCLLKSVVRAAE